MICACCAGGSQDQEPELAGRRSPRGRDSTGPEDGGAQLQIGAALGGAAPSQGSGSRRKASRAAGPEPGGSVAAKGATDKAGGAVKLKVRLRRK